MPGETPEEFNDQNRLREVMADYVDIDAFEIWRSATYRFNARVGAKWRDGRVFLAGDAMHQTPPFLGQGLCAGIRDVANLSWKLIRSLKHGHNDTLLDSYEIERLPHVSRIIEHAKEFGLIIGELDKDRAHERDKTLRAALLSGEMETSRQGFIPNLKSGLLGECELAGTLMVQPKRADGSLMDDQLPMTFLYLAADEEAAAWADPLAAQLKALGVERTTITADDSLRNWCKTTGARAALIRPDRYVWSAVESSDALANSLALLSKQLEG